MFGSILTANSFLFFRKKARDGSNGKENLDDTLINTEADNNFEDVDNVLMSTSGNTALSPYQFPPNSPVSPRVKNIKEDMEALLISRQDNPYICSKIELLSSSGADNYISTSSLTLHSSLMQVSVNIEDTSQSLISMEDDVADEELAFSSAILDEPGINLHEHLIRSPPPQFPQKVSHFVFPDAAGSPLRGVMLTTKSNGNGKPLSPSRAYLRQDASSPTPGIALLSLVTPPPAPPSSAAEYQPPFMQQDRRSSHPMDEDISPTALTLPPLVPSQRAVSGPLPALSPLPALHKAMNAAGSSAAINADIKS